MPLSKLIFVWRVAKVNHENYELNILQKICAVFFFTRKEIENETGTRKSIARRNGV